MVVSTAAFVVFGGALVVGSMLALLVGLAVVAAVPWLSIGFLP